MEEMIRNALQKLMTPQGDVVSIYEWGIFFVFLVYLIESFVSGRWKDDD